MFQEKDIRPQVFRTASYDRRVHRGPERALFVDKLIDAIAESTGEGNRVQALEVIEFLFGVAILD